MKLTLKNYYIFKRIRNSKNPMVLKHSTCTLLCGVTLWLLRYLRRMAGTLTIAQQNKTSYGMSVNVNDQLSWRVEHEKLQTCILQRSRTCRKRGGVREIILPLSPPLSTGLRENVRQLKCKHRCDHSTKKSKAILNGMWWEKMREWIL